MEPQPPAPPGDRPLRICLLSYRSNPHCGGQGVYLKNLSRAIADMGHRVDVLSGPPDPCLDSDIRVHRLPCLDLYDPADPFRVPRLEELRDPVNLCEWLGVATMGFPEPFTFGLRALEYLKRHHRRFDIVHDNQSLSYGVWSISRLLPTIATIHHPISIDLRIALQSADAFWQKLKQLRWYAFLPMQKQVARRLLRLITVSQCSRDDICRDFHIPAERCRVVPNGINTSLFRPLPGIAREQNRIMVTNSADTPLKGLAHLLKAVHRMDPVNGTRLIVIGSPKKNGAIEKLVRQLDLSARITFTGRISDNELVRQYARASVAVVPSEYEGFGLPVGEAMACGLPVVSTSGGALPEVVGNAGILVPPADPDALASAIASLLDAPEHAKALGRAGYRRVQREFTWQRAAEKTVAAYREILDDYRRF